VLLYTQPFILLHVDYLLILDINQCLAVPDTYSVEHKQTIKPFSKQLSIADRSHHSYP